MIRKDVLNGFKDRITRRLGLIKLRNPSGFFLCVWLLQGHVVIDIDRLVMYRHDTFISCHN